MSTCCFTSRPYRTSHGPSSSSPRRPAGSGSRSTAPVGASVFAEHGAQIARRAEVGELVGVDDRVDARDLAVGDLERQHGDQPLVSVEIERPGTAVDLDRPYLHPRATGCAAAPVDHRARDAVASAQRPRERGSFTASVTGQLHIVSEQRLEPGEIALLDRLEEPGCQLFALRARRLEAGPAGLDVTSGSRRELTDIGLALADDLGDLR